MRKYVRFDNLLNLEGPFDRSFVERAVRSGEWGTGAEFLTGYCGRVACISPRHPRSLSMDGLGHLHRPFIGLYVFSGAKLTEAEMETIRRGQEEIVDFAGTLDLVPFPPPSGPLHRAIRGRGVENMHGFVLLRGARPTTAGEFKGVFDVVELQTLADASARLGPNEVCNDVQELPLDEVGRALERAWTGEEGATLPAPRREPFEVLHVDWIVEESAEADLREWTRRLQEGDRPFKERRYGFAAPDSLIIINHRVQRVARARQGGNGRFLIVLGDMGDDWTISDLREHYGLRVELNERGIACWPGEQYALVGSLVDGKLTFPLEDIDLSKALFAPVAMDKSVATDRIRWFDSGWRVVE